MDSYHTAMIAALAETDFSSLVCPEYLVDELHQKQLCQNVIPYCLATDTKNQMAGIIIHKGLMHRIPFPVLKFLSKELDPVFANPVFLVLGQKKPSKLDSATTGEISNSLKILDNFIQTWGKLDRPKTTPKKAVIISAWNVGNIGDDVVTMEAQRICGEAGYGEVVLLGPNGNYDQIFDSNLVVIGGGGLIYDQDWANVSNYTAPAVMANNLGIPVAVLGVGTQGVKKDRSPLAFRHAFGAASICSVRDDTDVTVLEGCGIQNVIKTADLAFALPDSSIIGQTDVLKALDDVKKTAVISLSKLIDSVTGSEGYALQFCIDAIQVLTVQGFDVVLAQHSIDDHDLYESVVSLVSCQRVVLAEVGIVASLQLYRSASIVLTSRFHGVIFSSLVGVPVSIICSEHGKTGRLVRHDLKSLQSASHFITRDVGQISIKDVLRSAARADISEVNTRRLEALRNIDLMRGIENSFQKIGNFVEQDNRNVVPVQNIGKMLSTTDENRPKEREGNIHKQYERFLSELSIRYSHSIKTVDVIDLDDADPQFDAAINIFFGDSVAINRISAEEFRDRFNSRKESDVILVKVGHIDINIFKYITRTFNKAAVIVRSWNSPAVHGSVIDAVSIEVGLKEYAIFTATSSEVTELPIYALPEFSGTIAFFAGRDNFEATQDLVQDISGLYISRIKKFYKSVLRFIRVRM